jgi:uncharacterized protein (DUF305 family)
MRLHATVALTAVLLTAGCGTAPDAPAAGAAAPPSSAAAAPATGGVSGTFNDTDVMFLQMLGPHHTQGIEIVKIGAEKSTRAEIRTLAEAIRVTQAEEVTRMSGWLKAWKQPATADAAAHAAHGGMPGTSEKELAALRAKNAAEFDRDFLNTLIAHQDDAVQLARMETVGGANAQAKAFAKQVDQSRSAQLKQMLALLDATS